MTLCSLLLGVGYDAYVVSGYAVRKVTEMDERTTEFPVDKIVLENSLPADPTTPSNNDSSDADTKKENKYRVKPIRQLKSSFITKQQAKERAKEEEQQQKKREKEEIKAEEVVQEESDELEGLRTHFWILVLPGQREITDPFFIGTSHNCRREKG